MVMMLPVCVAAGVLAAVGVPAADCCMTAAEPDGSNGG